MNKIYVLGFLLLAATSLFTACTDDHDSNPTLVQPTEFHLNTPIYAAQLLDLRTSKYIALDWSQPNTTDKGAPLAGNNFYGIQISKNGNFTTSVAQASADESGKTVPDYVELEEKYFNTAVKVNAEAIAKALVRLYQWDDEKTVPTTVDVALRVNARFAGVNTPVEDGSVSIASNTVTLHLSPYYIEMSDAPVQLDYIVGGDVAGSWSNNVADAGNGLLPFFPIASEKYDKKTGLGKVSYTGYFPENGEFKIFSPTYSKDLTQFAWEYAYVGVDGKPGTAVYRNGGDDGPNIKAPTAGYYTIVIDNVNHTFTMTEATDIQKDDKGTIGIVGDFNNWENDVVMKSASTAANMKKHVWTADLSLENNTTLKFRADKKWDGYNWGSKSVSPYGIAKQGGDNIAVKKGNYRVFFNDLTGEYNFVRR